MAFRRRNYGARRTFRRGRGNYRGKSQGSKLNKVARMAKKTQNIVYGNIERSDWLYPEQNVSPIFNSWYALNFMFPQLWGPSCRRSIVANESKETFIKFMTLTFNTEHGNSPLPIHWTVKVVRAVNDWIPTILPDALRLDVDYSDSGNGNAPLLNHDRIRVLRTWEFNSFSGSTDPEYIKSRKHTFALNQRIEAAPISTLPAQQLWKELDDDAFAFTERIYILVFCNTPSGLTYAPNSPRINIGCRFSCTNI